MSKIHFTAAAVLFANGFSFTSAALAHPEMDRFGRDISSSPPVNEWIAQPAAMAAPGDVLPSAETTATIERSSTTGLQVPCRRHSHDECDVE